MKYLGGLRCVTGKCWLTWMVKNTKKCNPTLSTLPYPIHSPFLGILHVWTITQMPRGSCQLSLQRTRGNHKDAPTSHTAWSEIPQSHTTWSNGYGPEPVSVEDVVDVRCYTILSWMPETMTTLIAHWRDCTNTMPHSASVCHLPLHWGWQMRAQQYAQCHTTLGLQQPWQMFAVCSCSVILHVI